VKTAFLRTPGSSLLHCKLADTPELRAIGLSRSRNVPLHGMLFDFGEPEIVSMTMHETSIPLAMLFIDGDGRVRHVVRLATPGDTAPYDCPVPVRWVLETTPAILSGLGPMMGHSVVVFLPHGRVAA
jgi:uncharacterized membrane protein (UPF0127 family)